MDTNELRARRSTLSDVRKSEDLRRLHGPKMLSIINEVLAISLSLEDFGRHDDVAVQFDWPKDLRNASGLVAAYVARSKVADLLLCIDATLKGVSGKIGFHDKSYFGFAQIQDVKLSDLLVLAESLEESVLLHSDSPSGVVLIDYYYSKSGMDYSVAVQGSQLVKAVNCCFQK